jgi:hypothetical protein
VIARPTYNFASNPWVWALSFRRVEWPTPEDVKERPILFSGEMVRAILADKKTQTRRVMKPQPSQAAKITVRDTDILIEHWERQERAFSNFGRCENIKLAYGKPGDRLWIRETGWQPKEPSLRELRDGADTWPKYVYDADGVGEFEIEDFKRWGWKRRPSIFMPRWASRITLELTDVRPERLQDISEADAQAEGAMFHDGRPVGHHGWRHDYGDVFPTARHSFAHLWDSINGKPKRAAKVASNG